MKTSFYSFVLILFLLPSVLNATDKRDEIKRLSISFLDSLKITLDDKQFAQGEIVFRSITPVTKNTPGSFSDYRTTQSFTESIPINGKRRGIVSPPLDIFKGGRIAMVYDFSDHDRTFYELLPEFTFTSVIEGDSLKQKLTVKLAGNHPVSLVRYSMYDVEIWEDNGSIRQAENDPPILRRVISLAQEQQGKYNVTYFYKDSRGVIKGTDFRDGADISEPEFKGGELQRYLYFKNNMQYPAEALENMIGGTILVAITIDENGNVPEAEIFGSGNPHLNEEALRLARSTSGMWIPAQRNGKNRADDIILPIQFDPAAVAEPGSEGVEKLVEAVKAAREEPVKEKETGKAVYVIIFLVVAAIAFGIDWIRRKIHTNKYYRPNNHPHSLLNRTVMEYNEQIENDNLFVVTGITRDELVENVEIEEDFGKIIEMAPEILVIRPKKRMDMEAFFSFLSLLDFVVADMDKGKALAWTTFPHMEDSMLKTIPGMFYMSLRGKMWAVFVTTQDNRCWALNPLTNRYEPVAVVEPYHIPPYNYREL